MFKHMFVGGMSRSGTTLLATVLDSHRHIAMGYELLPANLPPAGEAAALIDAHWEEAGQDDVACAKRIIDAGQPALGRFLKRCTRTNVTAPELSGILKRLQQEGYRSLDSLQARILLSLEVVRIKQAKEGVPCCGFKVNVPSVEAFSRVCEESFFALIVRDPRDVVASHFKRNFPRMLEEITAAWVNYSKNYAAFAEKRPDRAMVVRYEDLVTRPRLVLAELFERAGLEFDPATLEFYNSNASIHQHGHVNADLLRQNFFTSSIGRWVEDLDEKSVQAIDRSCGRWMGQLGYVPTVNRLTAHGPAKMTKIRTHLAPKKRFYPDQYAEILDRYRDTRTNLTLAEAARNTPVEGKGILIVRHDIDHDIETAVKMAEWEAERGVRATYCVLHSAEYYGNRKGYKVSHSTEMVEAMQRIQGLGHEVCLHNNVGAVALAEGLDPAIVLEQELTFLRRQGLRIVGTASHGDKLCREVDFRNFEIFEDRTWESRGGVRTIQHKRHSLKLGTLPMARFGLIYEAYDLPRDIYASDAGGHMRVKEDTRGQSGRRRCEMQPAPAYDSIVGVLTHPVWWDFDRSAPEESRLAAAG